LLEELPEFDLDTELMASMMQLFEKYGEGYIIDFCKHPEIMNSIVRSWEKEHARSTLESGANIKKQSNILLSRSQESNDR
jgi:hypothetical protein